LATQADFSADCGSLQGTGLRNRRSKSARMAKIIFLNSDLGWDLIESGVVTQIEEDKVGGFFGSTNEIR
jgi:hypothetical protein